MSSDHPFQHLFETLGRVPASHAESVNRQAFEILSDILTVPVEKTGRCILLRAPRAGHGKTHLLSRIQHQLGASSEFIPVQAASGCRIDAASVTDDTLRRLVRQLPASGGLTVLDLLARRLFASALQPLVGSGEVPCQDREGALSALRTRPIETFDFHHPNAVTAHWARENFEVLGQRLSQELAQRSGLPVSGVSFWVDALFRFASAPLESTARVRVLADQVHGAPGQEMEHLEALLGLITQLIRVVLVADDLEGFSTDETAALRLAAFLGTLRQTVERLDVILSLNQDIWQSAFLPRLSGGLADRLSEVVVELEPLTEKEMADLLDSRVPGLGNSVLEHIDANAAGTHARGLIRAAGLAWLKATATDSAPAPVAPAPAAVEEVSLPPAVPPYVEPVVVAEPAAPGPQFISEPVIPVAAPVPAAAVAVETSAFTFSPEAESAAGEAHPAWTVPVYTPAEPLETVPASEIHRVHPESPFQIEVPEQVASFAPPQWQEASPVSAAWAAPAAAVQAAPEPAPHPEVVSHSFQVAESERSGAFSQVAVPVRDPADFPFSADSPFQIAGTPPAIPADEPPSPTFAPPAWPEPSAPFHTPPVDSPFLAEVPAYFTPASVFTGAPAPEIPAAEVHSPVESPFQVAPHEPAPSPAFQPAPASPAPTAADTDRVDDLLRQFRERYGRGSL